MAVGLDDALPRVIDHLTPRAHSDHAGAVRGERVIAQHRHEWNRTMSRGPLPAMLAMLNGSALVAALVRWLGSATELALAQFRVKRNALPRPVLVHATQNRRNPVAAEYRC
jgi:hypothetical protein